MSLEEILCHRIAALDKLIAEDDCVAQEREAARLLRSAARRSKNEALDALCCSPAPLPAEVEDHACGLVDRVDDIEPCRLPRCRVDIVSACR